MSELPIHRAAATKWASIMLGATVLAGALTMVVFVLPRPGVRPPSLKVDQAASAPKAPRRLPWEGIATDWSRPAADLEKVNAPDIVAWKKDVEEQQIKAQQEKAVAGGANGAATPPEGGGFAPSWRFLGAVIDGERRSALVVIPEADGAQRQRFVAEGFVKDEYKVVGIEPTKLVIEQGRRRHELPLAANQRGQGITSGAASPPVRSVSPVGAPVAGQPSRFGGADRGRDIRQATRPGAFPNPNAPVAPGAGVPAPGGAGNPAGNQGLPPPQPGATDPTGDMRQPAEPELRTP